VRLPVAAAPPVGEPARETDEAPRAAIARRILIVDDNKDSAESLAILLRMMGHEVTSAYDGEQALTAAEATRPDVVLLDIGLPKLNGYDTCRRIREKPWGQRIFFIALTGWGQEQDRRRTEEAGFDRHMVKPVDATVLTKLLASL
jgi:CheY-like chemotaxis protein